MTIANTQSPPRYSLPLLTARCEHGFNRYETQCRTGKPLKMHKQGIAIQQIPRNHFVVVSLKLERDQLSSVLLQYDSDFMGLGIHRKANRTHTINIYIVYHNHNAGALQTHCREFVAVCPYIDKGLKK